MKPEPNAPEVRWLPPRAVGLLLLWPLGLFGVYFLGLERWTFILAALDEFGAGLRIYLHFGANFGSLMLGRGLDLVVMALFLVSATLIGLAILRLLKWAEEWTLLNGLTALALGVLILGDAVLLLGLAGVMQPWVFWVLAIVPAVGSAFGVRRLDAAFSSADVSAGKSPQQAPPSKSGSKLPHSQFGLFEKFLLALGVIAVFFNLIAAFVPEMEYDALEYHLGAPKEYILNGRITFLPHCFYAAMPSLTEMLYTWAMVVRGDGAAKLFHWAFGVLTALAAYGMGAKFFNRRVGLLAAVMFYCVPYVTDLSMTARIDLATTFFATMAAGSAAIFLQEKRRSALWLAALIAGAAFSTKYTGGVIVVAPLAVAVGIVCGRLEGWKLGVKNAAWVLEIATVVVSPWLIKNLVFTGNPVFPLWNGLFHSSQWDAQRDAVFVGFHSAKFSGARLTAFAHDFYGYFFADAMATPLWAMLFPLTVFVVKWPRGSRVLLAWMGWGLLAWFAVTFRPWRFVFPLFPAVAVIAAAVVDPLSYRRWMQVVLQILIALTLLVQVSVISLTLHVDLSGLKMPTPLMSGWTIFLGQSQREVLRIADPATGWMNDNLPKPAVVLYVGEARAYHAQRKVLWNTVYDKSIVGEIVESVKSPEELRTAMKARGITHIYWNHSETNRLMDHYGYLKGMNWGLFNVFLEQFATQNPWEARFGIYELK